MTRSTLSDLTDVTATLGPVTITGSTVRGTYNNGISVITDEAPVVVSGNSIANNQALGCTFAPCSSTRASAGIYLSNTTGARVLDNVIRAYHGTGAIVSQATTRGSYHFADNALVQGNVIILDAPQDLAHPRFGIYCDGGAPTISSNAVVTSEIGIGTAFDCGAIVDRNTVAGMRRVKADKRPLLGYLAANSIDPNRAYHRLPMFTHDWDHKMMEGLRNLNDGHPVYANNNFTGASYAAAAFDADGQIDPSPAARLDLSHNWFGLGGTPTDSVANDGSIPATSNGHAGRIIGNITYTASLKIHDMSPVEPTIYVAKSDMPHDPWPWFPEARADNNSRRTFVGTVWMPDIDENSITRTIRPTRAAFDFGVTRTLIPEAVVIVQGYLGTSPYAAASNENW